MIDRNRFADVTAVAETLSDAAPTLNCSVSVDVRNSENVTQVLFALQ